LIVPPPVLEVFAVKTTVTPGQILALGLADKLTKGVAGNELTAITMTFEVAVVLAKHAPPLIVISHFTESFWVNVVLVNVFAALFCTLVPRTLKL
jgi:hypothetical protein